MIEILAWALALLLCFPLLMDVLSGRAFQDQGESDKAPNRTIRRRQRPNGGLSGALTRIAQERERYIKAAKAPFSENRKKQQ